MQNDQHRILVADVGHGDGATAARLMVNEHQLLAWLQALCGFQDLTVDPLVETVRVKHVDGLAERIRRKSDSSGK